MCTRARTARRARSHKPPYLLRATGQNAAAGAGVAALRPQHAAGDPVQSRAPGLPRPGRPVRLQTGRRVLRGKSAATSLPSTAEIKPVEVWLLFSLVYPALVIIVNILIQVQFWSDCLT